jgi:hypothetical protein
LNRDSRRRLAAWTHPCPGLCVVHPRLVLCNACVCQRKVVVSTLPVREWRGGGTREHGKQQGVPPRVASAPICGRAAASMHCHAVQLSSPCPLQPAVHTQRGGVCVSGMGRSTHL